MRPLLLLLAALACGLPAGAEELALVQPHQGTARSVRQALPENGPRPAPLIIALHGAGDDPAGFRRALDLDAPAAAAGFAVAWPEGLNHRRQYSVPLLRGPAVPPIMPDGAPLDDVAFLEGLVARLVAEGVAEPARVYLAGFSVGGLMTLAMGCARPERFAAIAVLSAGIADFQAAACNSAPPLPVLLLAGDADRVFAWEGFSNARGRMLSQPDTFGFLAGRNGCTSVTAEAPLPMTSILLREASGCRDGAGVALARVPGGNHAPPPGAGALLVGFLARYRR